MTAMERIVTDLQAVCQALFDEYRQAEGHDDIVRTYDQFLAVNNALNVLKDKETVFEYTDTDWPTPTCRVCGFKPFAGYVPTLKWMQTRGYRFCPRCGRAVKWDEET